MYIKVLRKQFLFVFLILASCRLYSQSETYTLDRCINTALQYSLEMQQAMLEVERTEHTTNSYIAQALPKVSITGNYQYAFELPTSVLPKEGFLGGDPGEFFEIRMGVPQTTSAAIIINQPLYNHSAFVGLRAIKPQKELAFFQMELTKETLIYNVSVTYYNLQIMELNRFFLLENQKSLEKLQQSIKALYSNQLIPETDVLQIDIRMLGLLNRLTELEAQRVRMYNLLKLLMGKPLEVEVKAEPATEEQIAISNFTIVPYQDVDKRPEVQMMSKQIELLKVDKVLALAPFMPSLNLKGGYGVSGNNTQFGPFETIQNKWFTNSFISLQLRIPIFSGLQNVWTQKAKQSEVKKAQKKLEHLKNKLQTNMSNSFQDYQAKKTIEVTSKRMLGLATRVYEQQLERYTKGLLSINVVLTAEEEWNQSRNSYVTALLDYKKSELEYQRQTGNLIP